MNDWKFKIFMFLFKKEMRSYPPYVGQVRRTRTGSKIRDLTIWDLENGYYIARDIDEDIEKQQARVQRKIEREKAKLEELKKKKESK